jgi:hypothetical protein
MELQYLWKTDGSQVENCPALYRVTSGDQEGYVVQGKHLDEATRAQLRQLGDDETAVFVPADVLDKLRGL